MAEQTDSAYWRERCLASEEQIDKFQRQITRVKELLDAKLREVDATVGFAEERVEKAEKKAESLTAQLTATNEELALYKNRMRDLEAQKDEHESNWRKQVDELTEQRQAERKTFDRKLAHIREWVATKVGELDDAISELRLKHDKAVEIIESWNEFDDGIAAQTHAFRSLAALFGLSSPRSPHQRPRSASVDISPAQRRRSIHLNVEPSRPPTSLSASPPPPPLPAKQSRSNSSAIPYVSLDPSNPGKIVTSGNATTIASASETSGSVFNTPTSGLTSGAGAFPLPTLVTVAERRSESVTPTSAPHSASYVQLNPSNPSQILLANNGVISHEDDEERNFLNSSTDSFASAVRSLNQFSGSSFYSDNVLHNESPYEVPIEELMRRCGTSASTLSRLEQLQRSLAEDDEDEEKIPPPLPHRNVPRPSVTPSSPNTSFESDIYSAAIDSINSPTYVSPLCVALEPVKFTASLRRGKFSYKDEPKEAPVFATLEGRAAPLRGAPFCGESTDSSASEADSATAGSRRRRRIFQSEYESIKRCDTLDDDENLQARASQFRLSSELLRTRSLRRDELEKSGYLTKLGSKMKNWKRYWFVLSAEKLTYYRMPSEVGRKKPRGVIELDCFSRFSRSAQTQALEISTDKRTYYLTADSESTLEEWMKVLQNVLQKSVRRPTLVSGEKATGKVAMKGWVVKVNRGRPRKRWCVLTNNVLSYYKRSTDKVALGRIDVTGCYAQEIDRNEYSGSGSEDWDSSSSSLGSSGREFTIEIVTQNSTSLYFLVSSKQEKDAWLYHLGIASGNLITSKMGSDTEKLIDNLMTAEGNPESKFWRHPVLSHTDEAITEPLTSLPSDALKKEAVKMFKSIQLFTSAPVNYAAISYHIDLAQTAVSDCLSKPELQNEFYCQLIRQSNRHPDPDGSQALQCWMLLAITCPIFLPKQKFLWYFKQYLQGHASMRPMAVRYAVYCQRCVERAESSIARECGPSRLEVLSVLLGDALKHSNPLSIPIHLANGTYQVISFDGSSVVQEITTRLSQELGMRDVLVTGFALFTDDPCNSNREHCLETDVKVCDAIAMWEQSAREGNQGRVDLSRSIKMSFKNRLYFRNVVRGETEKEQMLMLYQALESVASGLFPANQDLAIDLSSLMLQIEFGDRQVVVGNAHLTKEQEKQLSRIFTHYFPKNLSENASSDMKRKIVSQVAEKWSALRSRSASDCARIYLNVCRRWPFFGAKLISCQQTSDESHVLLAVQEHFISVLEASTMKLIQRYPYENLVTFGGHRDDFMIVVKKQSQPTGFAGSEVETEKCLFGMASPGLVVEATNLVASYINAIKSRSSVGRDVDDSNI